MKEKLFNFPGFQFLLGRLETNGRDYCIVAGDEFQFLLGRLETQAPGWPLCHYHRVSIPLR